MKDLSLHILDIVQNSIRAKASLIEIEILEQPENDQLIVGISDNGTGMNKEQIQKAIDPFYTSRSTRKVGLGLSLLKQNTELTGGSFQIVSEPGLGTKVTAIFGFRHLDRPILGDLVGTVLLLICDAIDTDYVFKHTTPCGTFQLSSVEIKQTLEDVPISHPDVRKFIQEMLRENLEQIQISE
jgi:hypothetical protein